MLSIATLFPDASRPNFGIFVERSLGELARQPGVTLTIVAPVGLPPWPLSLHPRYAALRMLPLAEEWHGLTVLRPRFTTIPGRSARNAGAVARAVMRTIGDTHDSFDVVDAQFFWPDGPAAQRIAAALGLPYSIKARGADISLWAQRRDTAALIADAAAHAGGLLAVAASLRDDMIATGMPRERITVHYTGLDAARFRPLDRAAARTQWDVADGVTQLLTVGALIERKGQALVIEALSLLPDTVHYACAGGGADAEVLLALARQLGVANRVRLLGPVANADLPSLYNAADIMVLPSASEGLANAWVEALGCGTPLVLSDIPPAHELIDNPDAGRIAARNPAAIAAAIAAMIAQPIDRGALASAAHARFNWQRNGAELAAHLRPIARW